MARGCVSAPQRGGIWEHAMYHKQCRSVERGRECGGKGGKSGEWSGWEAERRGDGERRRGERKAWRGERRERWGEGREMRAIQDHAVGEHPRTDSYPVDAQGSMIGTSRARVRRPTLKTMSTCLLSGGDGGVGAGQEGTTERKG